MIVRDFQRVVGLEARAQVQASTGRLPDAVVACVGGGSNAIGIFHAFIGDPTVKLVGYEAAGDGVETGRHAATFAGGTRALSRVRTRTCCRTRTARPSSRTRSPRAWTTGCRSRARLPQGHRSRAYEPITDSEAMDALLLLSRTEGIIPAIESAHAVAGALKLGREGGGRDHRRQPVRPWRQGHGHRSEVVRAVRRLC
ncbi:pyridoxal-phosphate dependent enzyme [Rhodococcus hoagii]|nr:pyridoxal-phosphate dependent enzyme [Prescottella equi]